MRNTSSNHNSEATRVVGIPLSPPRNTFLSTRDLPKVERSVHAEYVGCHSIKSGEEGALVVPARRGNLRAARLCHQFTAPLARTMCTRHRHGTVPFLPVQSTQRVIPTIRTKTHRRGTDTRPVEGARSVPTSSSLRYITPLPSRSSSPSRPSPVGGPPIPPSPASRLFQRRLTPALVAPLARDKRQRFRATAEGGLGYEMRKCSRRVVGWMGRAAGERARDGPGVGLAAHLSRPRGPTLSKGAGDSLKARRAREDTHRARTQDKPQSSSPARGASPSSRLVRRPQPPRPPTRHLQQDSPQRVLVSSRSLSSRSRIVVPPVLHTSEPESGSKAPRTHVDARFSDPLGSTVNEVKPKTKILPLPVCLPTPTQLETTQAGPEMDAACRPSRPRLHCTVPVRPTPSLTDGALTTPRASASLDGVVVEGPDARAAGAQIRDLAYSCASPEA
ncbi:hypothetical protein FB451DRAFT_1563314 [Mycena latifolia]|nr:hypothetical protein FB451DRAFT_1563314 [Mycena latifolia]